PQKSDCHVREPGVPGSEEAARRCGGPGHPDGGGDLVIELVPQKMIPSSCARGTNMKCFPGTGLATLQSAALLLSLTAPVLQAAPQSPDTQSPKGDPVLGERIAGGIVFDGKLWLRGVGGGLVSISLTNESRREHFRQGVRDAKKLGDDLWIIRCPSADPGDGSLSV